MSTSYSSSCSELSDDNSEQSNILAELRVGKKTKLFQTLKPNCKTRLYYQVVYNPFDLKCLAVSWVRRFVEQPPVAFVELLQFIADIASYQHIEIENTFEEGRNMQEIVQYLVEHPSNIQLRCEYLFKLDNLKWVTRIQTLCIQFVEFLVREDFDGSLITYNQPANFISFLFEMSKTNKCCLVHTSVVLATKLITCYLHLHQECDTKIRSLEKKEDILQKYNVTQTLFATAVKDLLEIFQDKSYHTDPVLVPMVKLCVSELNEWFRLFPDEFCINESVVGSMKKFTLHPGAKVRLEAVQTYRTLLKLNCTPGMTQKLIKILSERINDIDSAVSREALEVFTEAAENRIEMIPRAYYHHVIRRLFANNYPEAAAAGRFCMAIERNIGCIKERFVDFFQNITCLASLSKHENRMSIVVESLFEAAEELHDFQAMIDVLHNMVLTSDDTKNELVVQFICEFLKQAISGMSTFERESPRKEENTEFNNKAIAAEYFPNFAQLARKYERRGNCLIYIVDVLNAFNLKHIDLDSLEKDVKSTLMKLSNLFVFESKSTLLITMVEVIHKFEKEIGFENPSKYVTNNVILFCKEMANNYQLNSSAGSEINAEKVWTQTAAVFSKFDLTDRLKWKTICTANHLCEPKELSGQMQACNSFLLWKLKKLSNEMNWSDQTQIRSYYNEYLVIFTSALDRTDELSITVFFNICDLHFLLESELESALKLKLRIGKESTTAYCMTKVFEEKIVKENKLELKLRREYFEKYLSGMLKGFFPMDFPQLFRYYGSHQKEFGSILQSALKSLYSIQPNVFYLIISKTVVDQFMELEYYNDFDVQDEHVKFLEDLCREFSNIVPENGDIVIYNCINYASTTNGWGLLYFLTCFAEKLSSLLKQQVLDVVRRKMPNRFKERPLICTFLNELKSNKRLVRNIPGSSTSSDTSKMSDEYSSDE